MAEILLGFSDAPSRFAEWVGDSSSRLLHFPRMKKFWEAIVVLTLAVGGYLLFWPRHFTINVPLPQNGSTPEMASNTAAVPSDARSNSPVSGAAPSNVIGPDQLAAHAASPNSTLATGAETNTVADLPATVALDKARLLIHNYRAALGENPVGTNPEITAALKGKNPKQTDFLGDSGLRTNAKGELLDGYGTPFFFHQISGQEMEIRSAGPDHVMWNADDLVTK
jgi:hypothetical protein